MSERKFGIPTWLRRGAGARGSLFRSVAVVSALAVGSLGIVVATATEAVASGPTITVTPTTSSPGQYVQVSGTGWVASTNASITVDGTGLCSVTADASGNIDPTACGVPDVPAGAQTLTAEQNSGAETAHTTLTIVPTISYLPYSQFGPNDSFDLNANGFAGGSGIKAYLDSTSNPALATSPASPTTDSTGTINSLSVTIPAAEAAGPHTLILQDGSSNKAMRAITVDAPTFSLAASSGSPTADVALSGSGWKPNDGVDVYMGGTYFCGVTPAANGTISTACTIPGLPAGAHPVTAEQDANSITASLSTPFTIKPKVTYFPDPAAGPSATIRVDTEGLAANSAVTALLGTTVLITTPAHPSSDANGNMTDLMVTLPSNAVSGTITIKDASGNSATTPVSVYKPKVKLVFPGPPHTTSGAPGSYATVTGKGLWPNEPAYVYAGSTYFCSLNANAAGTAASYCSLPELPAGTYALSVQQDSGAINVAKGHLTIVPAIEYFPNPTVTGGATIRVDTYGLLATTAVTAKLSGVSGNLTTTPASPVTDANGDITDLMVAIPTSASAGSHTLTIICGDGLSLPAAYRPGADRPVHGELRGTRTVLRHQWERVGPDLRYGVHLLLGHVRVLRQRRYLGRSERVLHDPVAHAGRVRHHAPAGQRGRERGERQLHDHLGSGGALGGVHPPGNESTGRFREDRSVDSRSAHAHRTSR